MRISCGHQLQHDRHFLFLGHQYGCREVISTHCHVLLSSLVVQQVIENKREQHVFQITPGINVYDVSYIPQNCVREI